MARNRVTRLQPHAPHHPRPPRRALLAKRLSPRTIRSTRKATATKQTSRAASWAAATGAPRANHVRKDARGQRLDAQMQHRAVISERLHRDESGAGGDCRPGQWQRHTPEGGNAALAEGAGRLHEMQ